MKAAARRVTLAGMNPTPPAPTPATPATSATAMPEAFLAASIIKEIGRGKKGARGRGRQLASGLYAAEIDYLRRHEWAVSAADILWRRSKLGLHLPAGTEQLLDSWLETHPM